MNRLSGIGYGPESLMYAATTANVAALAKAQQAKATLAVVEKPNWFQKRDENGKIALDWIKVGLAGAGAVVLLSALGVLKFGKR